MYPCSNYWDDVCTSMIHAVNSCLKLDPSEVYFGSSGYVPTRRMEVEEKTGYFQLQRGEKFGIHIVREPECWSVPCCSQGHLLVPSHAWWRQRWWHGVGVWSWQSLLEPARSFFLFHFYSSSLPDSLFLHCLSRAHLVRQGYLTSL